jgi:hypothetical protein
MSTGQSGAARKGAAARGSPAGLIAAVRTFAKAPDPPRYPLRKIRVFTVAFYCVAVFELAVAAVLIIVYPDNYLAHAWELFFSELGAPVTVFGSPNPVGALIFSGNMAGGVIGCAAFIPIIQTLFPIAPGGFYRKLRFFYLVCMGMIALGNVGVIFPYTTHWAVHVISALVCMVGMWIGWTGFVLFNTTWLPFAARAAIVGIVQATIWFVIVSELAGWRQEFFQKPGQGLVFALVICWPCLHYVHLARAARRRGEADRHSSGGRSINSPHHA